MKNQNCAFCNPRKIDWSSDGFYGFRCPECQGNTAFILSVDHRGSLTEEEKILVKKLSRKYYPDLEIVGISDKRKNMAHWYDFLKPINGGK